MIEFVVTFDNGSDMYLSAGQLDKLRSTIGNKGYFVEGIEPREHSKKIRNHNLAFSSLVGAMNAKQMSEDPINFTGDQEEDIISDFFEGLMEIID